MRNALAMAALMAALSFGSGQAFAFQETPAPPPAEIPQAANRRYSRAATGHAQRRAGRTES